MTKYILNSGRTKNYPELTKQFFSEAVKGIANNPRFLICLFAQARENWEKNFEDDKKWLHTLLPDGVAPVLELAFPDTFQKQIQHNDIVYIRGGDDHLLQYWLKQFDLPKIWDTKVVITISAGSNALCTSFWVSDWRKCLGGIGILPIKFCAYYGSTRDDTDPRGPIDWKKARKELERYGDTTLPIHALKEGEFVIIEK